MISVADSSIAATQLVIDRSIAPRPGTVTEGSATIFWIMNWCIGSIGVAKALVSLLLGGGRPASRVSVGPIQSLGVSRRLRAQFCRLADDDVDRGPHADQQTADH